MLQFVNSDAVFNNFIMSSAVDFLLNFLVDSIMCLNILPSALLISKFSSSGSILINFQPNFSIANLWS